MSARTAHPTYDEWLSWVRLSETAAERAQLQRHLDACERCRDDVAVLRVVGPAVRVPTWARPPERLRRAVRALIETRPSPAEPQRARWIPWEPAGVRAGTAVLPDAPRVLARVFEEGELGLTAVPPLAGGRVRLQGRVWQRGQAASAAVVLLVSGDHVVAEVTVGPDGVFGLDEFAAPGWKLEVHLPGGPPLVVEDPTS